MNFEPVITQSGKGWMLRCQLWLPRPRPEIFQFFAEAGNLEAITPPFLKFHVITPPPILMGDGTVIDYRLKLRGIPLRWRSQIADWSPTSRFVDRQLRGPYREWVHTHLFEERDGGTLIRDEVRYRVPLGTWLHNWLVKPDLLKIFDYRQTRLSELFNSSGTSTGGPCG